MSVGPWFFCWFNIRNFQVYIHVLLNFIKMGIKDLWTILRPFAERKPLFELQGKTVAIDLSCWVCEAQNVLEYTVQTHMYLRNLYFRTCYLLLLGVGLVYVLEGKPPTLKHKTIASRNALQFKGAKPKSMNAKPCKDRSHFNYILKLCEEMLKCMGLMCVKGNGEAEAMCAYLNKHQFVDGCITQDSDCFAYGAKTVYRNFSISQQGIYTASGGSVDEYNIEKLELNNGIGRHKIIAMALLCGSDYSDGVFGIGKDSVLKLFNGIANVDILDRLRSWRKNRDYYEDLQKQVAMRNICTVCGHVGKVSIHNKNGCSTCKMSKGCVVIQSKDHQHFIKNELNIRKKALELSDFPNEEIINEYLNHKERTNNLNVHWQQPNVVKFVEFTKKYLQWEELYAFEKFLPILSRWHLIKHSKTQSLNCSESHQDILYPNYIRKIRNPKGIPSYEIVWFDSADVHKNLIPQEQLENITQEKLLSTVEPQYLVEKAYPKLIADYNKSKTNNRRKRTQKTDHDPCLAKKTNKKTKSKLSKVNNNLSDLSDERDSTKQMTINTYFQKVNTTTETNKISGEFSLDLSNFGDENDLNVSEIVDNILSYKQPKYIQENLCKIHDFKKDQLEASFFMKLSTDVDLFEQTFTKLDSLSSSEDSDSCD